MGKKSPRTCTERYTKQMELCERKRGEGENLLYSSGRKLLFLLVLMFFNLVVKFYLEALTAVVYLLHSKPED